MDGVFLDIGSIALGVIALLSPIVVIFSRKRHSWNNDAVKVKHLRVGLISMTCCMLALLLQIIHTDILVNISEWSSLLDTHFAVRFAAFALAAATMVLNAISLILCNRR